MRTKLAMFLVLAGGVAGCASNPPPPPMAMAPEPAPMAAPMAPAPAPMAGGMVFRGTVEAGADNGPRCRKMGGTVSTRVNRGTFALGGMRGKVGTDGAITSAARRGGGITGTLANSTMDVTETKGACTYHYVLNQA